MYCFRINLVRFSNCTQKSCVTIFIPDIKEKVE